MVQETQGSLLMRRSGWVVASLLIVYSLIGFLLLPWLLERQALPLLEQRLGGQSRVDSIGFNPFTFALSLDGFEMSDPDGEALLGIDAAYINFQATALLRGEFHFAQLSVDGLHVNLHRYSESDNNIARVAQRWAQSAEASVTTAAEDSAGASPTVIVDSLAVRGASIAINDEVRAPQFRTLVESIDFTLEDLSTASDASAQQQFTLSLGDGSQLHWAGDLSLAPLGSAGQVRLFGPITQVAYRYFQQDIPVRLRGGWFDASMAYEFSMPDDTVAARLSDVNVSLSDIDVLDPQDDSLLLRLPLFALSGGELDLQDRLVTVDNVLLGDIEIVAERFADGELNWQRVLPSTSDDELLVAPADDGADEQAQWIVQLGGLALERWQLRLRDAMPQQAVQVELGFAAQASNISNQDGTVIDLGALLELSSAGQLRTSGELSLFPEFGFTGDLSLDGLELPVVQPYLESVAKISLDSGVFGVTGELGVTRTLTEFSGAMTLEALQISDAVQQEALLRMEALEFVGMNVRVAEQARIDIAAINIRGPYARVEIEEDGSNNISRTLISAPSEEFAQAAEPVAQPQDNASLPVWRIDRVSLAQGSADFSDDSLPLPFAVHIENLGGDISTLSSTSAEPARINLEGQVDEYGLASISGRLRPLAYAELTEIDLAFRNLDVPSLSPYVIKFAGRVIDAGDLDVDLSYRINEGQLSGENAMLMRDLLLGQRVEHPDALDLPLGLAIALLKDRNGVIDLDVPVRGDLNSPQFNYGNVIRRALGNIITNIVSSPFRFLANLVGGDADADIGVIEFNAGRADLTPPEREKLAQLAAALSERPQLQLRLLGRYDEASDSAALRVQFFDRRLEQALAVPVTDEQEQRPAQRRLQLLEQMYLARAVQGADSEAFLLGLRQEHTGQQVGEDEQFDDLAYSEALRRALISLEPVSGSDLADLATQRAQAIASAMAALDANLEARVRIEQGAAQAEAGQDRVRFALELTAQ